MTAPRPVPMGPPWCDCFLCQQAGAIPGRRPVVYPPPPVPPAKDDENPDPEEPAGLFAGVEE